MAGPACPGVLAPTSKLSFWVPCEEGLHKLGRCTGERRMWPESQDPTLYCVVPGGRNVTHEPEFRGPDSLSPFGLVYNCFLLE